MEQGLVHVVGNGLVNWSRAGRRAARTRDGVAAAKERADTVGLGLGLLVEEMPRSNGHGTSVGSVSMRSLVNLAVRVFSVSIRRTVSGARIVMRDELVGDLLAWGPAGMVSR